MILSTVAKTLLALAASHSPLAAASDRSVDSARVLALLQLVKDAAPPHSGRFSLAKAKPLSVDRILPYIAHSGITIQSLHQPDTLHFTKTQIASQLRARGGEVYEQLMYLGYLPYSKNSQCADRLWIWRETGLDLDLGGDCFQLRFERANGTLVLTELIFTPPGME